MTNGYAEPCSLTAAALRVLLIALQAGTVLAGSSNRANSPYIETEHDFSGEIDTVISATRIRQPLTESPSSITIIDRDMISVSGTVELPDVLRLVPGVQVAYPQGNLIAATYHGFADQFPRNMQVLVDGRSVYQSSLADMDWCGPGGY